VFLSNGKTPFDFLTFEFFHYVFFSFFLGYNTWVDDYFSEFSPQKDFKPTKYEIFSSNMA